MDRPKASAMLSTLVVPRKHAPGTTAVVGWGRGKMETRAALERQVQQAAHALRPVSVEDQHSVEFKLRLLAVL